jgi:hypothetical protein
MNLGQYTTDLIALANDLQKVSADGTQISRIYHLALEIKTKAAELQQWATKEMEGME